VRKNEEILKAISPQNCCKKETKKPVIPFYDVAFSWIITILCHQLWNNFEAKKVSEFDIKVYFLPI
jgi:hypothetical protein